MFKIISLFFELGRFLFEFVKNFLLEGFKLGSHFILLCINVCISLAI